MTDALMHNARAARAGRDIVGRSIVVVGDRGQSEFWSDRLNPPPRSTRSTSAVRSTTIGPRARIILEKRRRGNFLGTLAAYDEAFGDTPAPEELARIDQLVMLVGSGTRLEPFTQALAGMKSAFPLPDPHEPAGRYTIGEAAIRSTEPIAAGLRSRGFEGIVVRWGDEVIVPSASLLGNQTQLSACDVVRFGYQAEPTAELAAHKEWLLVEDDDTVSRNISRQPLKGLQHAITEHAAPTSRSCVNLGSFAVSHDFLAIAVDVFATYWRDEQASVNWDPYFWIAYQSDRVTWRELETAGEDPAYAALGRRFPDFFDRVQEVKRRLRSRRGREPRIGFLDFGAPYWLDVGTHHSLRRMLTKVFSEGREGQALRALLGLPEGLASGESLVVGSNVTSGVHVDNSLILGATITDPDSYLERAIVLGGEYGLLTVGSGGCAIESTASRLRISGPHGIGLRIRGSASVAGDESVTSLPLDASFELVVHQEPAGD